jgi:PKD repeat protein
MRLVMYLVIGGSGPLYTNGCLPDNYLCATEDYTMLVLPVAIPPLTGFTTELTSSCSGQVQFRDTTAGAPTAWHWQFGDGTSSTLANPLHTYAAPGQYTVSLQATNAYGTRSVTRPSYVQVVATGQGPRPLTASLVNTKLCCGYGLAETQLGTFTYVGGADQPGYADETCQQPTLQLAAGNRYVFVVKRTNSFAYFRAYLWLDGNDNGVLEASEKISQITTFSADGTTLTGSFTVPSTALRNHPLRLRLYWHGLRFDGGVEPDPNPQVRDEDYDQVRDFTAQISGVALATTASTIAGGSSWTVSPNPATEVITLTSLRQAQELRILNSLGQLIAQRSVQPSSDGSFQLPVGFLANGLYYLQLSGQSGVRKLLINN